MGYDSECKRICWMAVYEDLVFLVDELSIVLYCISTEACFDGVDLVEG